MSHIEKTMIIHAPVAEVSAVAFDPHRWHLWYIGLTEPEEIQGTGEPGTVVKHQLLMAGVHIPVVTRVLVADNAAPVHRWDATIEGPFDGRHTWTYTPVPEGTLAKVVMDTKMPGAFLGEFVDRLFMERMQDHNMEQTLNNLKLLCESVHVPA